jgi:hypothetical protein
MTYRVHLYTKEELGKHGLTKEAFIVKRINNIENLSAIFGVLDNHLSDEGLRYRILKTIETILNDQEDMLYGAMSNYITFHKPA